MEAQPTMDYQEHTVPTAYVAQMDDGLMEYKEDMRAIMNTNNNTTREHDDHEALAQEEWGKQEKLLNHIQELGGFQAYINSLDDKDATFDTDTKKPLCLCCIDEAIRHLENPDTEYRLRHTAGSGILDLDPSGGLTEDPFDDSFISEAAKKNINEGVQIVSSHEGCGAGRAAYIRAYKLSTEEESKVTNEQIHEFDTRWALKVVDEMKKRLIAAGRSEDAEKVFHENVTFREKEMQRPESLHTARTVYYDGTNALNEDFQKLPQGFVISRGSLTKEAALNTTGIAESIAFGDHGFGERFNSTERLRIIWVGHDETHGKELLAELQEWLNALPKEDQQRVQIDGFTKSSTQKTRE